MRRHLHHRHAKSADHRRGHSAHECFEPQQVLHPAQQRQDREYHDERRQEDRAGSDRRPGNPEQLVADEGRQHQDRSRRQLPQRQAVDELLRRQPAELTDDLLLHEGQHREAAAEREGADLEEEGADVPERCNADRRSLPGTGNRQCRTDDKSLGGVSAGQGENQQQESSRARAPGMEQRHADAAGCQQRHGQADRTEQYEADGSDCDGNLLEILDRSPGQPVDRYGEDRHDDRADPVKCVAHGRQGAERAVGARQQQHDREGRNDEANAGNGAAGKTAFGVADENGELRRAGAR